MWQNSVLSDIKDILKVTAVVTGGILALITILALLVSFVIFCFSLYWPIGVIVFTFLFVLVVVTGMYYA